MPAVPSTYCAPFLLGSAHLQTCLPALFRWRDSIAIEFLEEATS